MRLATTVVWLALACSQILSAQARVTQTAAVPTSQGNHSGDSCLLACPRMRYPPRAFKLFLLSPMNILNIEGHSDNTMFSAVETLSRDQIA